MNNKYNRVKLATGDLDYMIDWYHVHNDVQVQDQILTDKSMDKLLSRLQSDSNYVIGSASCSKKKWDKPYMYHYIESTNDIRYILVKSSSKGVPLYYKYISNRHDDLTKVQLAIKPSKAAGTVAEKILQNGFCKKYNISTRDAYGYCDRAEMINCIPNPLYYVNRQYCNTTLHHVGGVDITSNYPSHAIGRMPTLIASERIVGVVEPTPEYPFCYYLRSGESAEYGVYDSRSWTTDITYPQDIRNQRKKYDLSDNAAHKKHAVEPSDEITLRCKASNYTLNPIINVLYQYKKEGKEIDGVPAKLVINSLVGIMHKSNPENTRCRLDHLAVVIMCRAIQQGLDLCTRIEDDGCTILHACVDGINYRDNRNRISLSYANNPDTLGGVKQEYDNCDYIQRGQNQYIVFRNGKFVKECHAAYNTDIITDKIEDIYKWRKTV